MPLFAPNWHQCACKLAPHWQRHLHRVFSQVEYAWCDVVSVDKYSPLRPALAPEQSRSPANRCGLPYRLVPEARAVRLRALYLDGPPWHVEAVAPAVTACAQLSRYDKSNLRRKEVDAKAMAESMAAETLEAVRSEVVGARKDTNAYVATKLITLPNFMEATWAA